MKNTNSELYYNNLTICYDEIDTIFNIMLNDLDNTYSFLNYNTILIIYLSYCITVILTIFYH